MRFVCSYGVGFTFEYQTSTFSPIKFKESLERHPPTRDTLATDPARAAHRPHVLYIIDQLCRLGGGETMILEIIRRLPVHRFRCSVITFQFDPDLEALKSLPHPLHIMPLKRAYDFNAAKMALRLKRLIQIEKVSLVHTFFETSDLWGAPIAWLSGCPALVSSRRDMGILRTMKHNLAYPIVNRLFDRVLAVSDGVRSYALHHDHLPPERVETLYNGVDLVALDAKARELDARARLGLQPTKLVVSILANIRYVKGIDIFVRAAARVRAEHPDAVFLVMGGVLEPETFGKLQALVDSMGIKDSFLFLGAMANPYPVLAASDVFCLPSRNEGFSNALIEAMGSYLPCVATRVGGNAEALTEGLNGFLVDSEDADAMADRLLRLLRDPELRRNMGVAARHAVESRFSMNAMMTRLIDIYDELLAARNA
jgi:glycosyltransferase involved in cell wall biosynthesis